MIEIAINKNQPEKKRGDLLEKLAEVLLKKQNYLVEKEIRNTGAEIDLFCKSKANNSKEIFVECKAFGEKKVSAEIINKLIGIKNQKKYQEAWLITTSELSKDAKGLVMEIEKQDIAPYFTFYTPKKLIEALFDSNIICHESTARQNVIDIVRDENKISSDAILLITELGYFWVFKYTAGGKNIGIIVSHASNGKVINDYSLLNNLVELKTSFLELNHLQIDVLIKSDSKDVVSADKVKLNKKYIEDSNEMKIRIVHPEKEDIKLSDVFIFPDLEDLNDKNIFFNSKKIFENNNDFKKCVIYGDELSGKTSLAKILQRELNNKGFIPLYLNASQIKSSNFQIFLDYLSTNFKNQFYNSQETMEYYNNLLSLKSDKIYIIIDDFDVIGIRNEKVKYEFLQKLKDNFLNIIIFTNRFIELEMIADSKTKEEFKDFNILEIKEFGHVLRDDLINRWIMLGDGDAISESDLLNRRIDIANRIDLAVGTNFVPTYPIYILTLLQLVDEYSKLKLQSGSYAELYSYLVNQSLITVKAKPEDFDFFHSYLSYLSYSLFKKRKIIITNSEFLLIHKEYCDSMDISKKFSSTVSLLVQAKIIKSTGNGYSFNHNYSYYYFVAKYLSDNIIDQSIVKEIDNIIEKIYKREFANIIVFFIHHSKNTYVIEKILNKARGIFKEAKPFTVSIQESEKINNLIHDELKMSITDENASEYRKNNLQNIDDFNKTNTDNDISEEDRLNIIPQIDISFKLIEILGQILKNYYGSIKIEDKVKMIDEIYFLGLRSLNVLLDDFQQYIAGIEGEINDSLENKSNIKQEKRREIINNIVFSFQEMLIFIFAKTISNSLASVNLFKSTDKIIVRHESPFAKILTTAVRINFPGELKIERIVELDKDFKGNYLAKSLLKFFVVEHLYKFDIKFPDKQKICKKLEIELKNKMITGK